jgi:transcriptional regulator GlxA family with amidase domain
MRRTVAILLFDEVEVLDFAGPFEVFAVTDALNEKKLFDVYTVAESAGVIRACNGLQVVPTYAFANAPTASLLVIPGGWGTRPLLQRPAVIEWIRQQARSAEITASVCTGSLLLAKAGLLEGVTATTHFRAFPLLRELAPTADVREDRRFLDHDKIITSAGISAGIDMSLHLVAKLHGVEVAQKTADQMEYHWRNDHGLVR